MTRKKSRKHLKHKVKSKRQGRLHRKVLVRRKIKHKRTTRDRPLRGVNNHITIRNIQKFEAVPARKRRRPKRRLPRTSNENPFTRKDTSSLSLLNTPLNRDFIALKSLEDIKKARIDSERKLLQYRENASRALKGQPPLQLKDKPSKPTVHEVTGQQFDYNTYNVTGPPKREILFPLAELASADLGIDIPTKVLAVNGKKMKERNVGDVLDHILSAYNVPQDKKSTEFKTAMKNIRQGRLPTRPNTADRPASPDIINIELEETNPNERKQGQTAWVEEEKKSEPQGLPTPKQTQALLRRQVREQAKQGTPLEVSDVNELLEQERLTQRRSRRRRRDREQRKKDELLEQYENDEILNTPVRRILPQKGRLPPISGRKPALPNIIDELRDDEDVDIALDMDSGVLQHTNKNEDPDAVGFGPKKIKGLYGSQIDSALEKYRPKGYLGWIHSDEIETIAKAVNSYDHIGFVMNTAKSTDPDDDPNVQMHWVGVFISFIHDGCHDMAVHYYDPLAEPASESFMEQIKYVIHHRKGLRRMLKFKENLIRNQSNSSETCGLHVIMFLERMFNCKEPWKKITGFDSKEKEAKKLHAKLEKYGYV